MMTPGHPLTYGRRFLRHLREQSHMHCDHHAGVCKNPLNPVDTTTPEGHHHADAS